MNIHKHMEAIFVVTLVIVSAGSFAFDSMRGADSSPSASASMAGAGAGAARDARTVVVRAPTLRRA